MLKRLLAVALVGLAVPLPVYAGPGTDFLREGLYAGEIASTGEKLKPLADAGEQDAKFGLGFVTFVTAIEDLAQALYRYGVAAPDGGPLAAGIIGAPLPVPPVPANPKPQPLTYDLFRGELDSFVRTLDGAATVFQAAGESGDYVVPLDVMRIRVDINDDGKAEESETVGNVIAAILGISPSELMPTPPEGTSAPAAGATTEIGFDRADAIWLAGYSNVIAAQADFLLAHDFSEMFNATFHRLFPKAGLPMQDFSRGGMLALDPESDSAIADIIALIHTINWPVVDHDRMVRVLERGRTVTALSRKNWDAILAETDDDRELLPNPRQTALVPDGAITDEMITVWLATLDTFDLILDGELLVPHWRFQQGFDLKTYFETAERTDFVMILTGHEALPFLKDGPIATPETFAAANRIFGDNLLGYAFWFN